MALEAGLPQAGTLTQREHHKLTDTDGNKFVEIRGINDAGTAYNAVHVADDGTLKTGAGGGSSGVQYTEGDTDTTITGTAAMWEDTADTLRPVSAAFPLPVNIVAGSSAGTTFDDGDAIDTDSQGTLILGATGISGTARVIRTANDGTVRIDPTGSTTQPISGGVTITSGTVTVQDGGNVISVDDAGSSLTVDGTVAVTQSTSPWVTADNQVVADNTGFTDGTTKLFMAGYILDDTAGTALSENDAAAPRISTNRAVVGVIEDGATRARYATVTAANALKVDASATTLDTELPAAAALADDAANPTTPMVGACLLQFDGTTWDRVRSSFSQTRTGVGTGGGAGASVDMTSTPMASFAMFVIKDGGTVTAFNITLEGSLDNANWGTIVNFTSATGAAQIGWATGKPVLYMRSNVTSITGAGGTCKIVIMACRAIA